MRMQNVRFVCLFQSCLCGCASPVGPRRWALAAAETSRSGPARLALGGAALRYNDAEELTRLIDGFDAEAHRARAREYERLYDAAGPEAVMFAFVKAFQPDRPAKC